VDGHWTDITRTYCLGRIDDRKQEMYDAMFAARGAALAAIRPGVRASDIDAAARNILKDKGFGDAFKHGAGHGVGFCAINHTALPRLHPASADVLAEGMVFNIEPAIYIDGYGGMRHCDMVLVTPDGHELLTLFQERPMEVG
jgi:Xaa-Pro aminopeptidase